MIGTTFNGRFFIEKELGKGGMGAVYKATDQLLGRSVAIKVLKDQTGDEVGKKLRLEAQILARLLHHNVVRLYDFGENQGLYFFVMEEVDGSSFQKRWRQVTIHERVKILIQVAEALDYAHRQGVIHRDVKPANVLMTSTDQAKLSDFGLSMLSDHTQDTGIIRGTPHYMSPEQAKGKRLDHRTDLYALGVMLYECVTGSTPFMGPSLAVIANHVSAVPESPRSRNSEIAKDLETLIMRLLAKEPVERPSTGLEVANELRELLQTSIPDSSSISVSVERSVAAIAVEKQGGSIDSPAAVTGATLRTPIEDSSNASRTPKPNEPKERAKSEPAPRLLALRLVESVVAEPMQLNANERYLSGHYLAYLLGGSRRRGFFQRRPLDPLNADRARLLLAMTSLMASDGLTGAMDSAVELLETKPDVRALLSPMIVMKYLSSRDTVAKRKRFRQLRKDLQAASEYASTKMTNEKGDLNPGLMPQTLEDLQQVSPERDDIDDLLVARWNKVSEVWRESPEFRDSVLKYATIDAWKDPAGIDLWPEVVYPLIERARWQRRRRSTSEAAWDNFCSTLRLPDAGLRLDHAIRVSVPAPVVAQLDLSLSAFDVVPLEDAEEAIDEVQPNRLTDFDQESATIYKDIHVGNSDNNSNLIRLANPDPVRFTMGELRALWNEAMTSLRQPSTGRSAHRPAPIGPYYLTVVPSIRGRSAGTVAIQGMKNKQIEMLTASIQVGSSSSKTIIAAWTYEDQSLIVSYISFQGDTVYTLWHAPTSHQNNYENAAALNHDLLMRNMETPDQLAIALTKRFRPAAQR